jgi:hypothetical protein
MIFDVRVLVCAYVSVQQRSKIHKHVTYNISPRNAIQQIAYHNNIYQEKHVTYNKHITHSILQKNARYVSSILPRYARNL